MIAALSGTSLEVPDIIRHGSQTGVALSALLRQWSRTRPCPHRPNPALPSRHLISSARGIKNLPLFTPLHWLSPDAMTSCPLHVTALAPRYAVTQQEASSY